MNESAVGQLLLRLESGVCANTSARDYHQWKEWWLRSKSFLLSKKLRRAGDDVAGKKSNQALTVLHTPQGSDYFLYRIKFASILALLGSCQSGSFNTLPKSSTVSSTKNPGPEVATSNKTPPGIRK